MKRFFLPLVLAVAMISSCADNGSSSANPLDVKFGDPYVLLASDGTYYMYGTGGVKDGFGCYSSSDLVNWKYEGAVYQGNTPDSWTESCFWAPEVYERNGKFYMFFSSNWKENPNNDLEIFKIGVAVSDSPTGPFKDMSDVFGRKVRQKERLKEVSLFIPQSTTTLNKETVQNSFKKVNK